MQIEVIFFNNWHQFETNLMKRKQSVKLWLYIKVWNNDEI